MARRNPDQARQTYERLKKELLAYGSEGRFEHEAIVGVHHPAEIFKLPPGPDRMARTASLLEEMRKAVSEIGQMQRREARQRQEAAERAPRVRPKEKPRPRKLERVFEGFRYQLWQELSREPRRRGQLIWRAKITKKGRELLPMEGAPLITEHERLNREYLDEEAADLTARRVINTTLTWYAQRGIRPKEKVRRTERRRKGAVRRTAEEQRERERERERERKEAQRREEAEARRQRKKEAKMRGRSAKVGKAAPGQRRREYIPRRNPEDAIEQARESLAKAKDLEREFQAGMRKARPDFSLLMQAYDTFENARANFWLAGEGAREKDADTRKVRLRKTIVGMFKQCYRVMSGTTSTPRSNPMKAKVNPTKAEHEKIGRDHLTKSEKKWDEYCKSCKLNDLLDAYAHLEIAYEELKHAGDKKGMKQAKAGIKMAREEIKEMAD